MSRSRPRSRPSAHVLRYAMHRWLRAKRDVQQGLRELNQGTIVDVDLEKLYEQEERWFALALQAAHRDNAATSSAKDYLNRE